MHSYRRRPNRVSPGMVSPDSGTGTLSPVRDLFGPRPFSAHVATVGYDYDFHRGVDIGTYVAGDTIHAVMPGAVIRLHRTHYGWETDRQLDYWTELDPTGSATFVRSDASVLAVSGSRVGTQAFPGGAAKWIPLSERVIPNAFEMRLKFSSSPSLEGGAVGFGLYDPVTEEHVSLEYDGADIGVFGSDRNGAFTADGTTVASGSLTWFRILVNTGSVNWGASGSPSSWDSVATEGGVSFTETTAPRWIPTLYWRSTDTNAQGQSCGVDFIGWYDDQTIDRFGNWLMVSRGDLKMCMMHFQDLDVELGQVIDAGVPIGTAGTTGFDERSGIINSPHVHLELIPGNDRNYTNSDPVNPLAAGYLPRTDSTSNVNVVRSTANDPDGVESWRLQISISREDQDFDLNEVILTGSLAARRICFDTRGGLNSDNDIPKESGVYIVPEDFNENSPEYEISVYFNKSVVGTSFTSARVADCNGVTLWDE